MISAVFTYVFNDRIIKIPRRADFESRVWQNEEIVKSMSERKTRHKRSLVLFVETLSGSSTI